MTTISSVFNSGTELLVKVPFELKDSFKKSFKTAQWSQNDKKWRLDLKYEKKARQWCDKVNEKEEELISNETLELEAKELEELEKEIAALGVAIAVERKLLLQRKNEVASKAELLEKLQTLNTELSDLKTQTQKEVAECKKTTTEIANKVRGTIDIKKVMDAKKIMDRKYGKFSASDKKEFNNAQELIIEEFDKLIAVGIRSKGMRKLIDMNFNRQDRDNPRNVLEDEIFDIEIIEKKED